MMPPSQSTFEPFVSATPMKKPNGHVLATTTNSASVEVSFLTAKEAARIARIHPVTLLRWARQGRVPHRRLGARKVLFPSQQFNEWLESGYTDSAVHAA